MEQCSHRLGPPLKCIFPVSNYYEEIETNDKKDVLILMALKAIAGFVDDYFEKSNIWVSAKVYIWKKMDIDLYYSFSSYIYCEYQLNTTTSN